MNDPALHINRELSQLEFFVRVLEQAQDPHVPLLERVRFLSICCTLLDEFFEIRVAGLKELAAHRQPRTEPDGLSAEETLLRIRDRARALVAEQYRVLNDVLLPQLDRCGYRLHRRADWDAAQRRWIHGFFRREVLPVLTPVGLDPAHPFPRILNKSLNLAVSVTGRDAFHRDSDLAIVQVPRSLPRVLPLPEELSPAGSRDFLMLSSIVHAHIDELFPGMEVNGCYQFRVTRDSDLWVDEEEVEDLMRALKGQLQGRKYGEAVRLEVADNCPPEMAGLLLERFGLTADDLYFCPGPVNLNRLSALHGLIDRPDLKFAPFTPRVRKPFQQGADAFAAVRRGDRLLHHPYDSFQPVVELLRRAARDPCVLAIKQTLYRTGADSPVVDALLEAARAGKEVTVLVELRARFDEEENITLAERLQQAGAKVAYGIVGYKTHAKMLLIVRRDEDGLRRYVHLSTGNYHHRTSQTYTDVGLLTCRPDLGEDVHNLFNQLTGLGDVRPLARLLQAPFTLKQAFIDLIDGEAAEAAQGRPARIVARMNALSDPDVIEALYRASRAGVPIDLIVRGHCALRPGVAGQSETIRVRSVVGRFLEHSRVFRFHAAGRDLMYCASADWMTRNLQHRVEIAFPVDDPALKARLARETLDLYLADDRQAWDMRADGTYVRCAASDGGTSAQQALLDKVTGVGERLRRRRIAARRPATVESAEVGLASPTSTRRDRPDDKYPSAPAPARA